MKEKIEQDLFEQDRRAHYETTDENDKLIINFRDINHTIHFLYEGRGSQKRILIILLETGTMTQRMLTERLGIQPGSASEVLSKLERSGLIVRTENVTDRRTTDITLTEQGKALAKEALAQRAARHEEMFSCLAQEEKDILLALLEKVNTDWQGRYKSKESRHSGRHGHGGHHGHFHGHEEGQGGRCDGNCRECPHPCGRGRGQNE